MYLLYDLKIEPSYNYQFEFFFILKKPIKILICTLKKILIYSYINKE